MERDERVILLGEDIGVYGGAFKATAGLLERFGPQRVIDTPVVEEAIVGAAIGASLRGLRPVVEMQFFDFAARAFDMITNFAAKHRYRTGLGVPIVIRGPSGGRRPRAGRSTRRAPRGTSRGHPVSRSSSRRPPPTPAASSRPRSATRTRSSSSSTSSSTGGRRRSFPRATASSRSGRPPSGASAAT